MKPALILLLSFSLSSLLANGLPSGEEELNKKIQGVVIPKLQIVDMTVPQAVLHMQELYKTETGEMIPIFLSPRAAAKTKQINLSTRNLDFSRNLQFFCSGHTANLVFRLRGNAIYICEPLEDYKISELKIEPDSIVNDAPPPLSCTTKEIQQVDPLGEKIAPMITQVDTSWGDHSEQLHLSKENPVSQKWNLRLIEVKPEGLVEIEDLRSKERISEYPKKLSHEIGSVDESVWIRKNFSIYYINSSYETQTATFHITGTTRTSRHTRSKQTGDDNSK